MRGAESVARCAGGDKGLAGLVTVDEGVGVAGFVKKAAGVARCAGGDESLARLVTADEGFDSARGPEGTRGVARCADGVESLVTTGEVAGWDCKSELARCGTSDLL